MYKKHDAFNSAYNEINVNLTNQDGFDAPKQYHHDPSKLDMFKHFRAYLIWAGKLYNSSHKLINKLINIYEQSSRASSSYKTLNAERKLNLILRELDQLSPQLNDIREDIIEFQKCILATNISEKEAEIEALTDQLNQLSSLENRIIETCNRKLYEISSSRMSFYSLSIALIALVVSMISLFQ